MKKITTFITVVLLSFLGAGLAWATLVPNSDPDETHLDGLHEGDQFFIRCAAHASVGDKWMSLLTPYVPGQETLVTMEVDRSRVFEEGLFTVEFTGTQVQATQDIFVDGFFLKNVQTNMYVCLTDADGMSAYLGLTSDINKASVWGIRPVVDLHPGEEEAVGKFYLFTVTDSGVWNLNAGDRGRVAGGFSVAFIGVWGDTDMNTWYDFIPAEEGEEDLVEKHTKLYEQATAYGSMDTEGHYYIMGGIGGYDEALVEEYKAVMYDNTDDLLIKEYNNQTVDWKDIVSRLEALIINLQSAELQLPEDGYYYIVSAYTPWTYEGDERAVYAEGTTVYWRMFESHETEPAFMWHFVKKPDGKYIIQNVNEGLLFTVLVRSGEARLTTDEEFGDTLVLLGNGQFNICVGSECVHPMGHSNGAGTENTITGYPGGINSQSAWKLIPIDQELVEPYIAEMERKFNEAKGEADKQKLVQTLQDSLINRIREIRDITKPAFEYELPDDVVDVTPLSYEDFESNAAMLDGAPAEEQHGKSWGNDGQGYGALIDNDIDTWFHTLYNNEAQIKWSAYNEDGTPAEGAYQTTLHNLGMKLSQPASNVTFQVSARHSVYYNNPTKINVEVSHDGINWTTIFYGYDFFTPTTDATQPYLMGPFDLGGSYEYVRFANHINDRESRRFFVFSELKVFVGARLTSSCQASTMDQAIVSNFLKAYSNANKYTDIVTIEDLDAMSAAFTQLEEAFAAFKSAFADPHDLLVAINKAEDIIKNFTVGTDMIGMYDGSVGIDDLATEIDNARELLDAGFYKQDAVDQLAANISGMIEAVEATVIQPDINKWYQFVFPSQEEFEANPSWLRDQAEYNVGETGEMSLALYDRVAAITAGTDSTFYESLEELRQGQDLTLRAVHDWEISNMPEVSLFRLIPVDDGKYVIQNKATGLYIRNISQGSVAQLTNVPAWIGSFRIKYLGQGCTLLYTGDYITGEETSLTLHFTWNTNNAVTSWSDQTIGSKSSIHVRVAGDVDDDVILSRDVEEEQAIAFSQVSNVTEIVGGTAYSIAGLFVDESDEENPQMFIGLKPIEKVDGDALEPGRPAIIIAEDDLIEFHLGTTFTKEMLTENGLHATEANINAVQAGSAVLRFDADEVENFFQVTGGAFQYGVNGSSAYLSIASPDEMPTIETQADCDIWIPIRGNLSNTAIKPISLSISLSGDVYDLTGKRVGTSRDLNKLSRGIYVVNGRKVLIP